VSDAEIHWTDETGAARSAPWRSESAAPAPRRVQLADDRMPADQAFRLVSEGSALLWQGDFQNARQLLQALTRRIARKPKKAGANLTESFNLHRMAQAQRARSLGLLLIPFDANYRIPLRRAPDVQAACAEAYGPAEGPFVVSLRELLGLIGAHEWRKKGVEIPTLGARIHPHYGVFSPVRGEYVDLVARAPLPKALDQQGIAVDVGTGTGVLAAVLAKRGVRRIIATDQDERALACAADNVKRLGFDARIELRRADLFPAEHAALIVCNPPWLPAKPSSPLEYAVYDPDSRMLRGFLQGLAAHLAPGGEGWLILSDLAEHLGLRSRAQLESWFAEAGLKVLDRLDIRPRHGKAADPDDPLHAARKAERTSLWRLGRTEG